MAATRLDILLDKELREGLWAEHRKKIESQ
jgi:hypothetical protein